MGDTLTARERLARLLNTCPPAWRTPLRAWTDEMRAAGRSDGTARCRLYQLRPLARLHPDDPWAVTRTDLITWTAARDWKPSTRHGTRAALVTFYAWAVESGHLAESPAARLPVIRVPDTVPRPAPDPVIIEALRACQTERNRRLVVFLAVTGARCCEASTAHTDDLIGCDMTLRGKGGRTRVVPLPPAVAVHIHALPRGHLFPGRANGHLRPGSISRIVSRLLPGDHTAHQLRSAAATAWAEELDIDEVATLLGHARVDTTRAYYVLRSVRRSRGAVAQAAERLMLARHPVVLADGHVLAG